ncbi:endonuclease 8-like 2 [Octodon degus]|uniref:Endonuclease 8-like 2 n=1 Tax=Octodon degus TaxID=10160 RepID=A0A6P3VE76_OCTDE|nr:endonuclease 8-like 2 [Octodon degus]
MPEGPSVRKFHHLASAFVGQQVVKTGGSSKKPCPATLQFLWLQDTQVHGKKLFLRFDADVGAEAEVGPPGSCCIPEPLQRQAQREAVVDPVAKPQKTDDGLSGPAELLPKGPGGPDGLTGNSPAAGAQRWLQVSFGLFGSIWVNEFSRAKKANKRGDWRDPAPRLVLHFDGGGFLAFYNCQMAWSPTAVAEPCRDILSEEFHRGQALEALGQPQPVCYTLLDQRYFSGLGNIIKNEALYRARIHPLSLDSLLGPSCLESLVDHVVEFSADWLRGKFQGQRRHTQVYLKEQCPAGHQVLRDAFGPPGGLQRLTWWCPQCQPQLPSEEPQHLQS